MDGGRGDGKGVKVPDANTITHCSCGHPCASWSTITPPISQGPLTARPPETSSPKLAAHLGKPKVAQLDVARGVDEHVLRLQVAVHCGGGRGAKQAGCGPQGKPGRGQQRARCPQGQLADSRKAGRHSVKMYAGQHPPMGMQSLQGQHNGAWPRPTPSHHCSAPSPAHPPMLWACRYSRASTMEPT